MTTENMCQPYQKDGMTLMSYSARFGENATSYNKSNKFNNWMAKNGNRVFYGAQLLGNIGLFTYAALENDWFTLATATNNLARNAYGSLTKCSEKKDNFIMGWGAASNAIQACSTLGGAPLMNAVAGGLASLTYSLRYGAHHLRVAGRKKELATTKSMEVTYPPQGDTTEDFIKNKAFLHNRKERLCKNMRKSKKMRLRAYNIEKVAATSFLGRGFSQLAAGIQDASAAGTSTGALFIFGALGMLKGDFSKSKIAKERCFFADANEIVKRVDTATSAQKLSTPKA